MNPQYIFDYAIRKKEGAPYGQGYNIAQKEENYNYDRYMSNDGWNRYLAEMPENHRKQYKDGDGGEIEEKRGRWGLYPPKMACYGSSSRILYTLLKGITNIEFEKKFATQVHRTANSAANLDAYLRTDKTDIFVEAKCREIYVRHSKVKASKAYYKVYECISAQHNNFSFDNYIIGNKNGNVDESVYYKDKPIVRFDIKQLISHFLGIAAGVLYGKVKDSIRFVYFIYNPEELQKYTSNNTYKLNKAYQETIGEIKTIDIPLLFKAVFAYQQKNLKIDKEMPKFEFVLADQNNIMDCFNDENF